MPVVRNEARGGRAFAFPVIGIVVLLTFYWIAADWGQVRGMMVGLVSTIH